MLSFVQFGLPSSFYCKNVKIDNVSNGKIKNEELILYFRKKDELLTEQQILMCEHKIVIPNKFRHSLLNERWVLYIIYIYLYIFIYIIYFKINFKYIYLYIFIYR